MPPEVLLRDESSTQYNEKVDIWACGIILYKLLVGRHPFDETDPTILRQRVLKGEFDTESSDWNGITKEAKDLVKKLLAYNAENRLSAADAVKDPWFGKLMEDDKFDELMKGALINLAKFKANSIEKITVYSFFSQELMTKTEQEIIGDIFKILDKDGDGELLLEELKDGFNKYSDKKF